MRLLAKWVVRVHISQVIEAGNILLNVLSSAGNIGLSCAVQMRVNSIIETGIEIEMIDSKNKLIFCVKSTSKKRVPNRHVVSVCCVLHHLLHIQVSQTTMYLISFTMTVLSILW